MTGTLGQNLTGTMTWIGSLLNGASFNYQGTVTLDSSGNLQFVYGGSNGSATWMYPGGATGTASGTMYQYPGILLLSDDAGHVYTHYLRQYRDPRPERHQRDPIHGVRREPGLFQRPF